MEKNIQRTLLISKNSIGASSSILVSIFAAWLVKAEFSRNELFDGNDTLAYRAWQFLLRFVAPVLLAFVLFDVATG